MSDQTLLVIILGIVALAMSVQAVALAGTFLAVKRLEERFQHAEREWLALRPELERLKLVIGRVAGWTDSAAEQIPRVAERVEATLDQFRNVARVGSMVLAKPLRPLGLAVAFWRGLKSGARRYRRVPSAMAFAVLSAGLFN